MGEKVFWEEGQVNLKMPIASVTKILEIWFLSKMTVPRSDYRHPQLRNVDGLIFLAVTSLVLGCDLRPCLLVRCSLIQDKASVWASFRAKKPGELVVSLV